MEKNYTKLAEELNAFLAERHSTVFDEAVADEERQMIIVRSKEYRSMCYNSVIHVEEELTFAAYHGISATVSTEFIELGRFETYPCIHLS